MTSDNQLVTFTKNIDVQDAYKLCDDTIYLIAKNSKCILLASW